MDPNINAEIVRINRGPVLIPNVMGVARGDQMRGSNDEQICELAGRICYDSLGTEKSRNSTEYHQHIGQVKHFSTIEHAWFTINIKRCHDSFVSLFFNRPQIKLNYIDSGMAFVSDVRVTLNLRHVIEWDKQSAESDIYLCNNVNWSMHVDLLGNMIKKLIQPVVPMIALGANESLEDLPGVELELVEPETDNEQFVSAFLSGGRGFSHEQVRHRFAMSQRSSRFCDESESPIVEHPLITSYLSDLTVPEPDRLALQQQRFDAAGDNRTLYVQGVKRLQSWLGKRGIDGTTARKQARGAMRNDLGNGLYTEMIFTASLTNWKHMFTMRSSEFADAEIRQAFCKLLPEFQKNGMFTEWSMEPAKDGLGNCVVIP